MAGSECLYDLLGVADDATDDELKRAYRESARRHHPDVNPGAEPGKFSRISSAYDVLRDSTKRRAYDASRAWQAGTDTGSTGSDEVTKSGAGSRSTPGGSRSGTTTAKPPRLSKARRERTARQAAARAEMEREFWIQEKARARHMAVEYRKRAARASRAKAERTEAVIRKFWFSKSGWLPMDFVALFTAAAFAGGSFYVWRESGRHKFEGGKTSTGGGGVSPPLSVEVVAAAAVKEGDARDR
jgi:curved DNA-binding protein CbpA